MAPKFFGWLLDQKKFGHPWFRQHQGIIFLPRIPFLVMENYITGSIGIYYMHVIEAFLKLKL
jgi:hypothetical protein